VYKLALYFNYDAACNNDPSPWMQHDESVAFWVLLARWFTGGSIWHSSQTMSCWHVVANAVGIWFMPPATCN